MMACRRFPAQHLVVLSLLLGCGCASGRKPDPALMPVQWGTGETAGLSSPQYDSSVVAFCDPPLGWKPDPLKIDANHIHQVWLSPTTDTAYGVIHFKMPLPVGADLALSGFLAQMKKTEGDATLLDRHDDPDLPGIRFTARGGVYTIRAFMIVRGWEGWTVYAGTERGKPINPIELDFALRARDHTIVGRPENLGK